RARLYLRSFPTRRSSDLPHLAVGDDVEPGALLLGDRIDRRVVPRLLEVLLGHAPQLLHARARRETAGQPLAVDQPVGLGVGTDQNRKSTRLNSSHVKISY